MSNSVLVEQSKCTNGHTLYSSVKYCPFCGVQHDTNKMLSTPYDQRTDKTDATDATDSIIASSSNNMQIPYAWETQKEFDTKVISSGSVLQESKLNFALGSTEDQHIKSNKIDEQQNPYQGTTEISEKRTHQKPLVAPIVSETNSAVRSQTGTRTWFVTLILIIVSVSILYFFIQNNIESSDCSSKLNQATKLMLTGEFGEANNAAIFAVNSCSGEELKKAIALKEEINQMTMNDVNCQKLIARIEDLYQRKMLTTARESLLSGDATCLANSSGKKLNNILSLAINESSKKANAVTAAIDKLDSTRALEVFSSLQLAHADHPELQKLKAGILSLNATTNNESSQFGLTPDRTSTSSTKKQINNSTVSDKEKTIKRYLEKAEIALGQNQFDAAKTQVENIIELDDKNTQAIQMWQRIKNAEKHYLESTIQFN